MAELGEPVADRLGGYVLERRLGAGGMGVVHLATSPSGRRVALKVIRPEYAEDPHFRARFRREVAAARKVGGAFTASVVDADPEGDPPWLATQFVPGDSLADRVERDGPLPVERAARLAAQLAEALSDIHRQGIVHRDLKPGNVLLAEDGVRVIDFGIALALTASRALTRTGAVVGTPAFMAPEQLTDPDQVGPATDVFALGSVLAFAVLGRSPFQAPNAAGAEPMAAAFAVVHKKPDLTGLPGELRPLVTACLAKNPRDRPDPATVLRLAVEAERRALAAAAPPAPRPPATGPSRRRLLGGAAAATVTAAAGGAAWALWPRGDETDGESDGGSGPLPAAWQLDMADLGMDDSLASRLNCRVADAERNWLLCDWRIGPVFLVDGTSGEVLWTYAPLGDELPAAHDWGGVHVRGDAVFVFYDDVLAKLSLETGEVVDDMTFNATHSVLLTDTVLAHRTEDALVLRELDTLQVRIEVVGGFGGATLLGTVGADLLVQMWPAPEDPRTLALVTDDGRSVLDVELPEGVFGSPWIDGRVAYFRAEREEGATNEYLRALHRLDLDRERWTRVDLPGDFHLWLATGQLLITDGVLYAYDGQGTLLAQDMATESVLWTATVDAGGRASELAVADGRLYLVGQHGRLLTLNAEDGGELWTAEPEGPRAGNGTGGWSAPAPLGDHVAAVTWTNVLFGLRAPG
ncbi:protein kinase domain-containing protein [Streptomyces litchfieldiae]|uniref:Protein kinase n=1 Tax=Streptomyces litchfieldiae TaxID=3075543 RepID=A0ABU2MIV6_9ACTN|nr:protein kinase [Streptomyces sp. DSM 44938]MDT0341367.1 protein kinase [Streptomyces sp. DSM 44938]